ncbi:hypothetical protein Maq22A_1p36760 (plasmid) [Methylobacterium aquaticum]|uniref:Uncharacterized protein n=1 Tax=Methylobacterium aquaticum TaxID=270351 RepID=A0A0C6FMC5_9HYPH|nr:hypothetical protein Maq22A_1p36760 [Methylobacterium aquaticum]
MALDPPAEPTITVVLSDGSVRRCLATGRGFAALLAELKAEQDAIPLPTVTGRSLRPPAGRDPGRSGARLRPGGRSPVAPDRRDLSLPRGVGSPGPAGFIETIPNHRSLA